MGARARTWRCLIGPALVLALAGCGSTSVTAPVEKRDAVPTSATAGSYTVREGDTLYGIAFRYGLEFRKVAAWNGIGPPYRIVAGQRLRLTSPDGERPVTRERVVRVDDPLGPTTDAASPAAATVQPEAVARTRSRTPPATVPARVGWVWPTKGRVLRRFAEGGNKGVDIGGRLGAPVCAAAAGRVVYSGSGLVGYGKLIILKHNNSYLSAYAHNDRLLVKEGDSVVGGQRIAHMGQTGTQEVKLHFEIRRDGKPVDPLKYLPTRGPRQEDSDA